MDKEKQELDVEELNQELWKVIEAQSPGKKEGEQRTPRRSRRTDRQDAAEGKKQERRKKRPGAFRAAVILGCVLLLLLATAGGGFFFLRSKGEKELKTVKNEIPVAVPEEAEGSEEGKIVVYKGERYCYNEDIISILCMGVDTSIQETGEDSVGANGQADALILAALDSKSGDLSLVSISRDSMVDVNKYNVNGQYLGTEKMQICLSYAYGDGKEKSCQNTVESVSRLMYGMPIHAYAAIDYDGISVLNDAVGGVTVEVLEDMTSVDPSMEKGKTVTLDGQMAHSYVRSRDINVLDSNNMRMARQKQYLTAFLKKVLSESRRDINVPLALYQAAGDYMVTDITSAEVAYLASLVLQKGISEGDIRSVPGEVVEGEYAEFIPDETGLYELVLDVFYKKDTN